MSKIALVTGSAKGIGKAIILKFASDGYDVVINYLNSKDEALKLKEEVLDKYQVRCLAIKCDVSNEDSVDKMFSEVESNLGDVSILVNNAAVDLSNLFHLKSVEEFKKTLDINLICSSM